MTTPPDMLSPLVPTAPPVTFTPSGPPISLPPSAPTSVGNLVSAAVTATTPPAGCVFTLDTFIKHPLVNSKTEAQFLYKLYLRGKLRAETELGRTCSVGLVPDQITEVRGYKVKKEIAAPLENLLKAAVKDLQKAKSAPGSKIPRDATIGLSSGYRSPRRDLELWIESAQDYMKVEKTAGRKLNDSAVERISEKLANTKATPGYSLHTSGQAVDFRAFDVNGDGLYAFTKQDGAWGKSWFYGWLTKHAAEYGFKQLPTEKWHWTQNR